MRITFHIEVPEEDLKRYLMAANAGIGREPVNADFPWDLERFAEYAEGVTADHKRFMGILVELAIEYLERG